MTAIATAEHAQKSTNVRPWPPLPPWPVRGGFQALGWLAPGVAGSLALRLFGTPPRAASSGEAAPFPGATPLRLQVRGQTVNAWRWGEGPPVLLVHGWGGHARQMAPFVAALQARGIAAAAFDAPAHGSSAGRTSSIPLFAEAIDALVAAAGPPRAAIAHSLGAAAVALAHGRGLPLPRAVFFAPLVDPHRQFTLFLGAVGLPPRLRRHLWDRAQAHYEVRWDELDLLARAPRLSAPLLLVHDEEDRRVPLADSAALAAAWPGARLVTTRGEGHTRVLAAPRAVAEAVDFVAGGAP